LGFIKTFSLTSADTDIESTGSLPQTVGLATASLMSNSISERVLRDMLTRSVWCVCTRMGSDTKIVGDLKELGRFGPKSPRMSQKEAYSAVEERPRLCTKDCPMNSLGNNNGYRGGSIGFPINNIISLQRRGRGQYGEQGIIFARFAKVRLDCMVVTNPLSIHSFLWFVSFRWTKSFRLLATYEFFCLNIWCPFRKLSSARTQ